MKRREFANIAVASMAAAGSSLLTGTVAAEGFGLKEGVSTNSVRRGLLKKDTAFFLSGNSHITESREEFDEEGVSSGLLAEYTTSNLSLAVARKDGTGVALGLSHSRLLRSWDGSKEDPNTEKYMVGFLFSYSIEKNGIFNVVLDKNTCKSFILSGNRKGNIDTANRYTDDPYLRGFISGKTIKLFTYLPQQVVVAGADARHKLKSMQITGEIVPMNFNPNLPDLQVIPEGIIDVYKAIFQRSVG